MNNKKTNDNEICMLCGGWKEERSPVCQNCFKIWLEQWEKDEETPLIVWTFQKAETCCASINQELQQAKRSFDEFQRNIKQEAYDKVNRALMGIKVSDFQTMLERKRQKLWKERDGDKLYGQLKRLEVRAQRLPEFTQELRTKIDQYQKTEQQKQEQEQ